MSGFGDVAVLARARAGGFCEVCGIHPDTQTHHRLPRRMGGRHRGIAATVNSLPNALRVCNECHDRIESDRAVALGLGLLLNEGVDPAAAPAFLCTLHGRGWWLLNADTTITRVERS